jgi:hypothetical protein
MSESADTTKSLPAKRQSDGKFPKGKTGNPRGRPKGSLSKTTRFLQILTPARQKQAMKVLDATLRDAEAGDADARKLVLTLLQPFVKREAEKDGGGGGDKRPMVNVIVNQTEGRPPAIPAVRVIDAK